MESNELIGYVIILAIVVVLVCVQLRVFCNNCKLIDGMQSLFPSSKYLSVIQIDSMPKDEDNTSVTDDKVGSVKIFQITSTGSGKYLGTFQNILDSINNYLCKNRGAVSDFMLIKDIVERNCDSKEEEINTQTPIPLYIGLMGTMIGIIIGIGRIAILGGGFSAFIDNPQQAIGELMGGVAIAMLASLMGIILTTISSWKSKTSKSKLEANKNEFYSWIQAELLPVLSGNMANTLQLLQQNLTSFNLSFSSNISRMENALKEMSGSFENQLEILNLLDNLDIKRMATANIAILQQFEKSTANFQQFVTYISQTSTYLQAVRQLNDKVGQYMEQTSALTNLSNYFQEENDYFQTRRSEVNQTVVKVDDILKKSFKALQDNAEQGINSLTHFIIEQQNKFKINLHNVDEQFQQWLTEQHKIMAQQIEIQNELFSKKTEDLDVVINEVKEFANIKEYIDSMEQLLKVQNNELANIVSSLSNKELMVVLQEQQNRLEQIILTLNEQSKQKSFRREIEKGTLSKDCQLMMQRQNERIEQLCVAIENIPSESGVTIKPSKKDKFRTVALWLLGIMLFLASGSVLFIMSMFAMEFIKK